MKEFNLEDYLTNGVERIVKGIWKRTVKNPAASLYFLKYLQINQKAGQLRKQSELQGEHIPPFLIASITTSCNLHCKGCYARANHHCFDEGEDKKQILNRDEWSQIFSQAETLGVSFILLAGGEPMLRKDVLEAAGSHKRILFPVFTNGTMFTADMLEFLSKQPNLLPVLSIEGEMSSTDARRGKGTYRSLMDGMHALQEKEILFGSSVTVQKNNIDEVMGDKFLQSMIDKGCKAVIYVEYVPVHKESQQLAPDNDDREYMKKKMIELREKYPQLLFISFPGDEKTSGGCLAAGRGFFHINAYGGAEPCPFSAYSDTSLKEVSLKQALQSPLFRKLQDTGTLMMEHEGGCVLYEQDSIVKEFVKEEATDDNEGTNY